MDAKTRLALDKAAKLDRLAPVLDSALDALTEESLSAGALWRLGQLCFSAQDRRRASEFWEEALSKDPQDIRVLNDLGALELTRGRVERAERYLLEACRAPAPGKAKAKIRKQAVRNLSAIYQSTPILHQRWMERNKPSASDLEAMARAQQEWKSRPKISILMPHFNQRPEWLNEAIESMRAQVWTEWELIVADDASTDPAARAVLERHAAEDPRVRVRWLERNMHIAGATNRALEWAGGDWIGFLDSDDALVPETLHEFVRLVQERQDLDLIYSDNATIDADGDVTGLMLKPAWSPEFFLSTNYIVHFCMYSRRIVERIGPFREEDDYKGVQDVDIKARLLGLTDKVGFVPKVLYLWRETDGSVSSSSHAKPYVLDNARRVFQEVLDRRCFEGRVDFPSVAEQFGRGIYKIAFPGSSDRRVTVVVRANAVEDVHPSLLRFVSRSQAARAELLVIVPPKAPRKKLPGARVVACADDEELLETLAELESDYLVFLDPGAEPNGSGWLAELRGYLDLDPAIGIVGGKILDKKNRVSRGAWLLLDEPTVANRGQSNRNFGFWFNNVIASNVSAVDAGMMIVRRAAFVELGGMRSARFGELADIDLCLRFRDAGYRVVFNPWAEALIRKERSSKELQRCTEVLREVWGDRFGRDPFYNPGYSQTKPWVYDELVALGLPDELEDATIKNAVATETPPPGNGRKEAAPAVRRSTEPMRINFVLPPSPKITGGPLAILEYANRLTERGHDVSVTTYPDLYWSGASPFPWFDFKGRYLYKELRPALRGDLATNAAVSDQGQFFDTLVTKLLKTGGLPVLDGFLMSIGCDPQLKREAGLDHLLHVWLRSAWLMEIMPRCDLNIATFWETAFPVFWSRKGKPVYFMQHFEEVFYTNSFPAFASKMAVRASYGLPLYKVANSSWLRRVMLDKYGQNVPWSNNGIELSDFQPREKDSQNDGVMRIVTYSRPEDWKGFCDAAEAIKLVREAFPGRLEWHVFGYRNSHVAVDDPRAAYEYHEGLSFQELAKLYARCDVALCPSWYESFPLPPLEAMASGTAVVTTDYGTEDYAFHEKTALVVQPRRVREMADAVLRLLNDDVLRQRLARAGRAEAERYGHHAVDVREGILRDIHEGRIGYDVFRSSKAGLYDGAGIEFERAPADLAVSDGQLVRASGGVLPAVYLVHEGAKRHVVESSALTDLEFCDNAVEDLEPLDIARIPQGSPIFGPYDVPGPRRIKQPAGSQR